MPYEYTKPRLSLAPEEEEKPPIKIGPLTIPIPIACFIWGVAMLAGVFVTIDYQWLATPNGKTPELWPSNSQITAPVGQPVVLMFLHPHCPCSRSSLAELSNLMTQVQTRPSIQILFLDSAAFSVPVEQTAAWRTASTIRHATVHQDQDGRLSRLFGANSSGTTVLYDKTGRLQFAGGITAGRGHAGTNPGIQALTAYLNGSEVTRRVYPVFGCPISEKPLSTESSIQ